MSSGMITSINTVTQVSIKFSDVILFEFMMIFIHISFLICVYFIVNLLDRQRRKHTHTTPTHVNRQTDKECAWGRPRLVHTVLKCCFLDLS